MGCHAECEKYKAWRASFPKRESNYIADSFIADGKLRSVKKWHKK